MNAKLWMMKVLSNAGIKLAAGELDRLTVLMNAEPAVAPLFALDPAHPAVVNGFAATVRKAIKAGKVRVA